MQQLFLPLIFSFLVSLIATPLAIKLAKKYNMVDDPKVRPHPAHIQQRVIPRAGGIPIFISLLTSILIFVPLDKHIIGILLAITILLAMGLMDDLLKNFSPYPRLGLQFLAAVVVVISGVGITFVTDPFGGVLRLDGIVYQLNIFGTHTIVLIADIFALFWIVWMMNMVNWSKGVDGQMPGIIAVAGLIIGLVAYDFFIKGDFNQLPLAIMGVVTSGAALGFLVFNWHPAKIIPGFSGSNILAFMIATLCILSSAKLATALLVLLVPTTDFFYIFFRRILSGKNPFRADRKHLHHHLLNIGWSHQTISLFYIISCAILGLLAINLSSGGKLFVGLGVGISVLGGILWLNFFGRLLEKSDPDNG